MKIVTLSVGVFLAAALSGPLAAAAAGPNFCRDYARAAVRQSEAARQSPFCARAVPRNPRRWSLRWQDHFDWCLTAPFPAVNAEREARRLHLLECRR